MRKLTILTLTVLFIVSCTSKSDKVERIWKDGVEIIINHLEPHEALGKQSILTIETKFIIDTSSIYISKAGLFDIIEFGVDFQGNIFCVSSKNPEYLVFKFDKNGRFLKAFGKRGQGPGEIRSISSLTINNRNNVEIYQIMPNKILIFHNDGTFLDDITLDSRYSKAMTLENGNYLVFGPQQVVDPSEEKGIHTPLSIVNSDFKLIKELDRRITPNLMSATRTKYTNFIFQWSLSKKKIFVGNEDRGYEILVYDILDSS